MTPGDKLLENLFKYNDCNSAATPFEKLVLTAFDLFYRAQIIPCYLPQYSVPLSVKYPHFGDRKHDRIIDIKLQHGDAFFNPFSPQVKSNLEVLELTVHIVEI